MNGAAEFAVHFSIRKGLGPDWVSKTIFVAFDDIDPETSEWELKKMARDQAESELYNSPDYKAYGKNWIFKDIERT